MSKKLMISSILAFVLLFPSLGVCAKKYPSESVNFIVAYSPGGGTDVSARNFEPFLRKYLGGSVAIVNKPGGNGEVGFSSIAKAKPDGYTIGMINLPVFFINQHTRKTTYTTDEFEILAPMGGSEHTIGVQADSPIKDLNTLIELAKKDPGKLTIGSSGNFSDDYLAYLLFQSSVGIELTHVPFKGAGPARTAVLGGHTDLIAFNVDESIPFVQSGQIRLLGIMSGKRHEMLPDVPTFKEQGFDVVSSSSRAVAAPKGLPKEISDQLKKAVKEALLDPDHVATVKKMGQTFEWMELPEYIKALENDNQVTKKLLEAAGGKK